MYPKEMYLGALVGMALFLFELKFLVISPLIRPIPSVFIIAMVVGLIAGSPTDGSISVFIAEFGGILIAVLLSPFTFPEWWIPDATYLGIFFGALMLPIMYMLPPDITGWEALGAFIAMLFLTPIIYTISIALGGAFGWIGKKIRKSRPKPQIEPEPTY